MRIFSRKFPILALLILILGAGWIYFPPYHSTFMLDDFKQFEFVRGLQPNVGQWWVVFRPDWIGWHYRPMHHLLVMAGMSIFATTPLPYYLFLLVLHGLVTASLILLGHRLGYPGWAAFVAGAIFAIVAPHWQVVGWISSLTVMTAALFSLLALIALVDALHQQGGIQVFWRLAIALVCFLLALFSREETLLLFPLATWMILTFPSRRWREPSFVGFAALLLAVSVVYVYINLARPTWTFNADAKLSSIFTRLLSLDNGVAYLEQLLYGYWAIEMPLSQFGTAVKLIVLAALILLGVLAYRWLSWGGKLGLLWSVAGLAFIFALTEGGGIGLPQPAPQPAHLVPSDRYLYLPWIGLSLAIGAGLGQLVHQTKVKQQWIVAAILVFLFVNAGYQIIMVRQRQTLWQPEAATTQSLEKQLKELLPEPPQSAHFYAMRAADIPDYFQAMASTWYGHNFAWPGGELSRLLKRGWATPDDYVFDVEDGVLYELMPELRTSGKTWLLLQQAPQAHLGNDDIAADPNTAQFSWSPVSVVGPADARRLGVQLDLAPEVEGWHSLCYSVTLPSEGVFRTALYIVTQDQHTENSALHAQVRLLSSDGSSTTLWGDRVSVGALDWLPINIELGADAGKSGELCIEVLSDSGEVQAQVAWANPRITSTAGSN